MHQALRNLLVQNNNLLDANAALASQLEEAVASVDQEKLYAQMRYLQAEFSENFRTEFT